MGPERLHLRSCLRLAFADAAWYVATRPSPLLNIASKDHAAPPPPDPTLPASPRPAARLPIPARHSLPERSRRRGQRLLAINSTYGLRHRHCAVGWASLQNRSRLQPDLTTRRWRLQQLHNHRPAHPPGASGEPLASFGVMEVRSRGHLWCYALLDDRLTSGSLDRPRFCTEDGGGRASSLEAGLRRRSCSFEMGHLVERVAGTPATSAAQVIGRDPSGVCCGAAATRAPTAAPWP
jgi:hypothetical protein